MSDVMMGKSEVQNSTRETSIFFTFQLEQYQFYNIAETWRKHKRHSHPFPILWQIMMFPHPHIPSGLNKAKSVASNKNDIHIMISSISSFPSSHMRWKRHHRHLSWNSSPLGYFIPIDCGPFSLGQSQPKNSCSSLMFS